MKFNKRGAKKSTPALPSLEKSGIIADYLPWILIALAVLVILMTAIFLLKGKGVSLIDRIKNLFNFKFWLVL